MLDDGYEIAETREKLDYTARSKIKQTIQAVRYNYREQELNATRQAEAKALKSVNQLSKTMTDGFQDMKTYVDDTVRRALKTQARSFVKILRDEGILDQNGKVLLGILSSTAFGNSGLQVLVSDSQTA
ncbi:hypothetical protein TsFJ059_009695 [Trichoderma semiorbis]|uniref:Uncharacterized protein n=1 Tax=Trichoderma semiorbis TaxID=1491008 RepID=A0A9P8HRJ2_9HYPO|nr:hypothetical protein TsFJ059_009695 [Trichoderma semiorbis]